jgi:hypothetical protein
MSISASWISVEGLDRAEFLQRLGLVQTEETCSILEEWLPRRSYGGVVTPSNGRELFISRYADLAMPEVAERVSLGAQLVMCNIEEHVMVSEAYSYTDGKLDWLIQHNIDETEDEIVFKGQPPASLHLAIANAAELDRSQGGADYYFDVPMDVVGPIAGFRPDEEITTFDGTLTLVERKGKGGILKWLRGNW